MVEISPFPYQGPLEPYQVQGRQSLVQDLVERLSAHRVTALLGPRRFGKTSLLRRVADEMKEVTTVWVDLYEVTSMADVVVRFDDAIGASSGPFSEVARRMAAAVSINLGLLKAELSGPARARPDPAVALHAILGVLVDTALREPTVLVVDEFSSIYSVSGAAGALRTVFQHHYNEVGIVFAGSHPSMMRTLFTDRAEPFFSQADLVEVGPLSIASVEEIVASGFASTGRTCGPIGGLIGQFTAGHPQRAMQLADACWRRTGSGETADFDTWAVGLNNVRQSTAEGMERLFSGFGSGERDVLRAVARSGSVYGAEAKLLDLSVGAATHARNTLLDGGDLVRAESGLAVADPVFADWIRRRFPI